MREGERETDGGEKIIKEEDKEKWRVENTKRKGC